MFIFVLEFLVLVKFEPVRSAEPPMKFSTFEEKNSREFRDDFLVASSFLFLRIFDRKLIESLSLVTFFF